jgi:hypothetical protein
MFEGAFEISSGCDKFDANHLVRPFEMMIA